MNDPAKIYDCFTFFNELDLLEVRLNILDDVVDEFVLVEGTKTYQGDEKELHYENNKSRFSEFRHKINHVVVEYEGEFDTAWDREDHLRNSITRGLTSCDADDRIMVADVDEIPRPKVLNKISQAGGIAVLGLRLYYYFFNCQVTDQLFAGPVISPYEDFSTPKEMRNIAMNLVELEMYAPLTFDRYPFGFQAAVMSAWASLRRLKRVRVVPDAGWHFSYLSDVEGIIRKIETFSHTEYDRPEFKNPDQLRQKIQEGKDLFDRDHELQFVDFDEEFPDYLLDHRREFEQFIV